MIRLHTGNGHGSTNNKIRRFSTEVSNLGNAITYADSATLGASFTIEEDGVYMVSYSDDSVGGATAFLGVSLNSSELTTNIGSILADSRLCTEAVAAGGFVGNTNISINLNKGDIIRPHTNGSVGVSTVQANFTISKIGVGDLLGVPVPRTAYIKDVKSSGTSGGTFTSGAWQTRTINTLSGDTEFISIGTGTTGTDGTATRFTLESGKYEIEVSAPAYQINQAKTKLYNITDSLDQIIGSLQFDASSAQSSNSFIIGTVEISSPKIFEVQHRSSSTSTTNGFGRPFNVSVDEVYTQVKITKVS